MISINDNTQINQTLCHNIDDQQDRISTTIIFEPFKLLLNDLIEQNKQLKQDINQLREQSQSQQQLFLEQLNQQSTKIEELQNEINQLKIKSIEHTTEINKFQNDYQNQNFHLLEVNQSHNLLQKKVKSIQNYINYPRKSIRTFKYKINLKEIRK